MVELASSADWLCLLAGCWCLSSLYLGGSFFEAYLFVIKEILRATLGNQVSTELEGPSFALPFQLFFMASSLHVWVTA